MWFRDNTSPNDREMSFLSFMSYEVVKRLRFASHVCRFRSSFIYYKHRTHSTLRDHEQRLKHKESYIQGGPKK